jgi:GTPase SAR1 family protein
MHLKINEAPDMKKIHFSCDEPIHPKLEKYPLTREFLNMYNTTAFVGTQGSGKTSLMLNFLTGFYKKTFHYVYVFMPKTSRNSLHNNVFDKHLPKNQIYEELNESTIHELYEKLKVNSMRGYKSLVIYDDVQRSLKDYNTLKSLKNIIANQRHLKVVNLILLQNFFALDKSLRELINNIILFKLGKSQNEKIFNEIIESHRDRFDGIRKLVFDAPHQWMFVNVKSQRVFKCFNEIVFDEEEEEEEVEVEK